MTLWVTMGYFDGSGACRIAALERASGRVDEVIAYLPEPALRVPGRGFTGGAWLGAPGRSDYLVCSSAAVHRLDPRTRRITGHLFAPSFNDLHHVNVHQGRIYVVNTGLDCVDVLDLEGRFLGSHSFEAAWLAAARQRGEYPTRDRWRALQRRGFTERQNEVSADRSPGDYYTRDMSSPFHQRKVRDQVHPNHIAFVRDRPLVTSLERRALIDLHSWTEVVHTDMPPHDGQVVDGALWLTTVDGHVECHAPTDAGFERVRRIDVSGVTGVYGWCRGLCITRDFMAVGFTEMRRAPRHGWARADLGQTRTAVVLIDHQHQHQHQRGDVLRVFDLSDAARHSKIFAITEVP